MIRILNVCFELRSNAVGRRFSSIVVPERKQFAKKRKRKERATVEKKSKVTNVNDHRVQSSPEIFKMFEESGESALSNYVTMKSKHITENLIMASALQKIENEKMDIITNKKKLSSVAARHRKEMNEKAIASLLNENKLLAIYSRSVMKNYLHACVNSNDVDKAYHTLIWQGHQLKNSNLNTKYIITKSLYNIVLKGYALNGNLERVHELFRVMKRSKVIPNMESFAYHLLCLVNQSEVKDADIQQVLHSIRSHNLNPSRLFVDSTLNANNRSLLKQHLLRVDPSLEFKGPEFDDDYECRLMKNFNYEPRTAYLPLNDEDLIDYNNAFREQVNSEKQGFTPIKAVCSDSVDDDPEKIEYYRSQWKYYEDTWRMSFTTAFENGVKALKNKYCHYYGMNILPFLTAMKQEVYIDVMLHEMQCFARNLKYSPPVINICRNLGKKVMNRYLTNLRVKHCPEIEILNEEFGNYYKNPDLMAKCLPRQFVNNFCTENGIYLNSDVNHMNWSQVAMIGVGRFLYNMILSEAKIDVNVLRQNSRKKKLVPVFFEVYVTSGEKTIEQLRCNVNFSKLYQFLNYNELYFDANELPMLVPPFPWISTRQGGYLFAKTDYVRECGNAEDGLLAFKLVEKANLSVIHDALNVLSSCAWRINEDVLDVAIDVFCKKEGEYKVYKAQLDLPLHRSELTPLPKIIETATEERLKLYRKRMRVKRERDETYSLWCDTLYKLSIANHFRKRIFWFPQNVDFRGRVYAVPPHFSHLGGDLSRSILKFAKGKPLGPNGLDWLKIHVVNLTGTKKRSTNQQRLEYADEIMPLILDSAENPLTGTRWWMSSDEPWQTLACCMEIAKASKSPNPEEYISHFPVHQDGSCNGLQHYAALGRDEEGAISVNLSPDEKPNDVYATVASNVEKLRQIDASKESEIAKKLDGFINRKVVKQTVMTYVYGVTQYGAREQILKRLRENKSFPHEHSWTGSIYLTQKTFEAIRNMFTATRKIQEWFTGCARVISSVVLGPVEWVTPLGFPVAQPYFKQSSIRVPDSKSSEAYVLKDEVSNWRPNTVKQKNAFPPNFIHSLDSSHMMLTALHCEKKGITFAAVHDSYWTHPSTVDEMNKICRQQFVALHSEPILSDLSQFMVDKYEPLLKKMFADDVENYEKNLDQLKAVPETGSFDLEKVLKSVYFFS